MNAGPGIRETNEFKKLQRRTFFTKADYPRSSGSALPSRVALETILAHHLGEEIVESDLLERSTLHFVYRITLPDKSVILRINRGSRLYRELSFYIDIWIYSVLTKKNIPAMKVYAVDTRRKLVPWDYEIVEDVGKISFYDLTKTTVLTPSQLRRAGTYMARVHSIPLSGWGQLGSEYVRTGRPKGVYKTWRSYVRKNLDTHVSSLRKSRLLTSEQAKQCTRVFQRALPPCTPRLLHGDVANHNIFPKGNDVIFIDWEDALAGDPVYDVAYFGSGAFNHPEWLQHFLKGYTTVNRLPADFDMRYWLYFLRISIAKAVVRLKEGKDIVSPDSLSALRIHHALSVISKV